MLNLTLTIIGILVSGFGLYYAIMQVKGFGQVKPERIFVVSPVMFEDSEERLKKEFPEDIAMKFTFRTFAVDNEKEGNNIIPGIGGQVYGRLGLGDGQTKNRYTPELVIHRMSL